MKPKKKGLSLKKSTVSNLSSSVMERLNGGATKFCHPSGYGATCDTLCCIKTETGISYCGCDSVEIACPTDACSQDNCVTYLDCPSYWVGADTVCI